MSPAVIAALIQALIAIGPSAIQALEVLIKMQHHQPITEADHAKVVKAITEALQIGKPA
jgi:hypothetical protein